MCLRGFEEVQDDTRVRTPQMKVTRVSVHMADYAANYVVYPWPPKQRCAHLEQPGSHFQQESFWRCELPVALYASLGKDCLCALDAWMARRLRREQQTGLSLRLTQAQPGRAPPSSFILPLLRMIDGWTSIKLLHQKDLQGKWHRPGIAISSQGLDEVNLWKATTENPRLSHALCPQARCRAPS